MAFENLYFRTDGNSMIGLGHVIRCMSLAQMVNDTFSIHFYIKDSPENVLKMIQSIGFEATHVATEAEFFDSLTDKAIVVLDGYHFTSDYQKAIKERGCLLVCIDDLHDKVFFADLIINQAPGIRKEIYICENDSARFLLGLDYVLLREAFLVNARLQRKLHQIENLLVCFGGADFNNYTLRILTSIAPFASYFKKIYVVTGRAYLYLDQLHAQLEGSDQIEHHHDINEETLIFLMRQAQLVIVPASGILLEAIAIKCLPISGYYNDNQLDFYRGLLQQDAIVGVDDFQDNDIHQALKDVLFNGKRPGNTSLIDGKSGFRIRRQLLGLYYSRNLRLRSATAEDVNLYFEWVNDERVRANSKDSAFIKWETHKEWFSKKLESADTRLYLFYVNEDAVGQVRFELNNGKWVIDFSIGEPFRGLGLGRIILTDAMTELKKASDLPLISFIKGSNLSSARVFENAGFSFFKSENGYRYYTYEHAI